MMRMLEVDKCAVIPFGNFHIEQMQLQDNSFHYTVNAPHNAVGSLPPTSNADYDDTMIADELDHPSKRRKVSNPNTQDTLLKEPEEASSSYNFFASIDPNGSPQTATSLPPVLFTEDSNGIPQEIETEPLPMGTPPPTVPFSEDPVPQEQEHEAVIAEVPTEYEVQETIVQQPPSETDNEVLSAKKKRGRPKKQDTSETADSEPKIIVEHAPEIPEQQATKKKPGRPKKQETDTTVDQPLIDYQKETMDEADSTTATKPSKKKVKRSKTTSDIPDTKSNDLKAEQDVVWVETNPIESAATDGKINTTEQVAPEEAKVPKKRGRKKKEVVEEAVTAAASTENHTVLQDISNIQQAPQQERQKGIEVEINVAEQKVPDGVDTSNSTNIPETPTVEIQSKESKQTEGGEGGGVATPTPQEKNKSVKQTPISSASKVPFRVGLSRRARIAPLLKVVRK